MLDYKCLVQINRDGHEIKTDTIITIEDDIIIDDKDVKFSKVARDIEFERDQMIESLLLEQIKEKIGDNVELIDFEEIIQSENLYKIEYKDVYFEDKARYDYEDQY